jgi:replicative DNA helicase
MIDFTQNIDSLEAMVWNFIMTDDLETSDLKPKNHDSLRREELINMLYPKYFNNDIRQDTYKVATKFFKEYKKIPNKKELKSYLELNNTFIDDDDFEDLYLFNLREYNYDYLYKYVRSFILLRNLNLTVFDLLAYLKTTTIDPDNIDKISEKVRNDINSKLAVSFSSGTSGLDFFDPESHIQIPKNGSPSGFKFFDKVLGGGWNAKTLVVFQGRPKVGKSMVLGNIACRSFLAGNVTGLVTVELSERAYMKRLGSNMLSIKADDYSTITSTSHLDKIRDGIIKLKAENPNLGELKVGEFPTGSPTAIDIENYFLRLEGKLNKKFQVIVVDYINLLRPIKEQNGLYEKVKSISEELRAVAMRNEWCIITATQIKREDVNNFDLGMESVAESFGLIHTVDSLFGLMRNPLEGRMKIKIIANRDNGFEESYKFYTMHKDYFKLLEEVGLNSEFYSDDEEAGNLADQVREEHNELNKPTALVEKVSDETDYDELLKSM